MSVDRILVDRLTEFVGPPFCWDGHKITVDDVMTAMQNGIELQTEEYQPPMGAYGQKSKEWHMGRIAYFVKNPNKITPLDVDNACHGALILPHPVLMDGHHRLMALIIRKRKWCEVNYSGLMDVLGYLQGKINISPRNNIKYT